MALVKKNRLNATSPKNINELRDELNDIFFELRNGTMKPQEAKEMNNAAGKIIGTLKVQIEYAAQQGTRRKIEYLER